MPLKHLLAAAFYVATSLSASANDCPVAADLETGIRITRDDPYMSAVLTGDLERTFETRLADRDGKRQKVDSVYSHPLAVIKNERPGLVLETRFEEDTSALQHLDEIGIWESDITLVQNGKIENKGKVTRTFLEASKYSVGNCTYDVWWVKGKMALDDGQTYYHEQPYAPNLGMTLAFFILDAAGKKPISGFQPDRIEAVK